MSKRSRQKREKNRGYEDPPPKRKKDQERKARRRAELGFVKHGIQPILGQQFGVGALFAQTAVFQHQNLVRRQNRGQPVGNHQTGATLHHPLQRLLNQRLRQRIKARGCFIQHQNARVFQHHTGNGNPLPLAAA